MDFCNQEFSFLIQQIVRTMEMEPEVENDSVIWVDNDWKIHLPDDDPSCVVIEFDDLMNPHAAADIAMRFSKVLDLMGANVMVATKYNELY
jgi:hypothetical protein